MQKSERQRDEEGREETLSGVRESVLWFLGRRLEGVADVQREMVERRVRREVERGRSVLYMAKTQQEHQSQGSGSGPWDSETLLDSTTERRMTGKSSLDQDQEEKGRRDAIEQQLSPEQLQLFAQENQDMLKHYEDTLDQVRYVTSPSSFAPHLRY